MFGRLPESRVDSTTRVGALAAPDPARAILLFDGASSSGCHRRSQDLSLPTCLASCRFSLPPVKPSVRSLSSVPFGFSPAPGPVTARRIWSILRSSFIFCGRVILLGAQGSVPVFGSHAKAPPRSFSFLVRLHGRRNQVASCRLVFCQVAATAPGLTSQRF
jgi:hypothetical protein